MLLTHICLALQQPHVHHCLAPNQLLNKLCLPPLPRLFVMHFLPQPCVLNGSSGYPSLLPSLGDGSLAVALAGALQRPVTALSPCPWQHSSVLGSVIRWDVFSRRYWWGVALQCLQQQHPLPRAASRS